MASGRCLLFAEYRLGASIKELAERYDLNPKTVMKWRKRPFVHNAEARLLDRHVQSSKMVHEMGNGLACASVIW